MGMVLGHCMPEVGYTYECASISAATSRAESYVCSRRDALALAWYHCALGHPVVECVRHTVLDIPSRNTPLGALSYVCGRWSGERHAVNRVHVGCASSAQVHLESCALC